MDYSVTNSGCQVGACLDRHGSQKVCPQGSAKGFFLSSLADLQQHGSVQLMGFSAATLKIELCSKASSI